MEQNGYMKDLIKELDENHRMLATNSQATKVSINKEYFREKFEKVIDPWFNTCQISVLSQLDVGDKERLVEELMKCFEDEK